MHIAFSNEMIIKTTLMVQMGCNVGEGFNRVFALESKNFSKKTKFMHFSAKTFLAMVHYAHPSL